MFNIVGNSQHGISNYDITQQLEQGSSNSHTDSANSQEPLWAYQKSPSDHIKGFHEPTSTSHDAKAFTSKAQSAYDNPGPPTYPFIDETPTDPDRNYFAYHDRSGRPMSGQYNCSTGMGESQYSYQGLPDPSAYFDSPDYEEEETDGHTHPEDTSGPNIFICDNSLLNSEGIQTPNTRARRVVHEVIV